MTAAGSSNRRRADRPVWVSQVGSHRLPMFVRRSSIHNLGWPLARVQSCRSQSRLCVIVVMPMSLGAASFPQSSFPLSLQCARSTFCCAAFPACGVDVPRTSAFDRADTREQLTDHPRGAATNQPALSGCAGTVN